MNDIERARKRREESHKALEFDRDPDVVLSIWTDDDNVVRCTQFITEDMERNPVGSNRAHADLLFDALWQSTGEEIATPESEKGDRVVYIAYCDYMGRRWTRLSDCILDEGQNWKHGLWHLRNARAIAMPLVRIALCCTLMRYRNWWPLKQWKWLQAGYIFDKR